MHQTPGCLLSEYTSPHLQAGGGGCTGASEGFLDNRTCEQLSGQSWKKQACVFQVERLGECSEAQACSKLFSCIEMPWVGALAKCLSVKANVLPKQKLEFCFQFCLTR